MCSGATKTKYGDSGCARMTIRGGLRQNDDFMWLRQNDDFMWLRQNDDAVRGGGFRCVLNCKLSG